MNIAVVDDQEVYHAIVKDYFQDMKEDINIYCFDSVQKLEESKICFHIVLLDIDMPDINGIDYAREHIEKNIIFVSAHSSYIKQAFGPNVYAFIEKTDSKEMFQRQIIDVMNRIDAQKIVNLKVGNEYHKVYIKDIIYVQYIRRKTLCVKMKTKEIEVYGYSIKDFANELGDRFIYIDRDTICNIDYIFGIVKDKLILKDTNHQLRISSRRRQNVKRAYLENIKQ